MDKITTKDLLLATKDKLSELQGKLDQLGHLTYIDCDKNIDSVRYVLQTYDKKPELDCVVKWNDKRLKGIYNNFLTRINLYIHGRESGKVLRDNNGNSYINISDYSLGILEGDQDKFREIADELFNDEFVREFLSQHKGEMYYPKESKLLKYMSLYPDNIHIDGYNNNTNTDFMFSYNASDDTAYLVDYYRAGSSNEILYELLNVELDSERLSEYQRHYIESSPSINKEIFIQKFDSSERLVNFSVDEDEKKLILERK